MTGNTKESIKDQIIAKAKEFGADLVGIADVNALKNSPSHLIYGKLKGNSYNTAANRTGEVSLGKIAWPERAQSAITIAIAHPKTNPELDWWQAGVSGGTPGNRILMTIADKLHNWLVQEKDINTQKLPYHIEYGGILLKDAAVMAGMGCLGKNNLFVTPEFGPRVRLRVILTENLLPGTEPLDFDPCIDCDMPCRRVCPQKSFQHIVFSKMEFGIDQLPARTGHYNRLTCNTQMLLDEKNSKEVTIAGMDKPIRTVRNCRRCEFACPIGRTGKEGQVSSLRSQLE